MKPRGFSCFGGKFGSLKEIILDKGIGAFIFRARLLARYAYFWVLKDEAQVAQLVEHILGKDEVTSSILVLGS